MLVEKLFCELLILFGHFSSVSLHDEDLSFHLVNPQKCSFELLLKLNTLMLLKFTVWAELRINLLDYLCFLLNTIFKYFVVIFQSLNLLS